MIGTVKNKIRLGTIFLFFLVMSSGGVGIFYLVKLRQQTNNILTANYESLQYAHRMQIAFDSLQLGNPGYADSIEFYLQKQETNITEDGEKEATALLRNAFVQLQNGDNSDAGLFRQQLQKILSLNMQAIQQKSENSEAASEKAVTIIITSVAIILLIGFTFSVNFPSVLTDPITKLTEAINEISQKNYHHRIYIQSKDEFGQLANSFNEMAERLEYFESSNVAKLIFEKSRAEAVINSLKDASIGIDKNDTILFANEQALQLLGVAAKEVVGVKSAILASRNDLFRFLLEEKTNNPFKVIIENRENYFLKETIEIEQESTSAKLIVLKNITSFKELDVAKTNFIATISHELKTPLAASDFSLKLLNDERIGKLTPEQKELINNLSADNQRMVRILSELLNLAQIETGRIQLKKQPVTITKVVEESVTAVAAAAKEKTVQIEKSIPTTLPEMEGDPDKIVWILNNLLTNAIKFSPPDDTILLQVVQTPAAIEFSVKDHGPGIEASLQARIFERFYQVPGQSSKKGSGIGLAICKEMVEAMGGTIWVKSNMGEGSTFGFTLPFKSN
ncbi:ATP-binding protein [Flavihumibacter sp. RY-1]|uniref:histidine kinase n=1 Tax=Flavihumibacter fluminis TaxID=2909236 RepID=A0ABS9BKG3_9BACT|nr:ATP-binding protein [Flavihumibacter fluminis]MCF1715840.1 ATP-binding protein [Flavihumibacter fluminis]